jgi:hypothetical protein
LGLEKEAMKMRLLIKEKQTVIAVMQDECREACEKLERQIPRNVGRLRRETNQ